MGGGDAVVYENATRRALYDPDDGNHSALVSGDQDRFLILP